jgi:hypothetical protein
MSFETGFAKLSLPEDERVGSNPVPLILRSH